MACKTSCKLCPHLVLSQSVTFANDTLTINIPAGSYMAGEKYCLVIAQALPDTATINAPVVITIGAGTTAYPLTDCNCAQATAESIHTRTRYATRVATSATGTGTGSPPHMRGKERICRNGVVHFRITPAYAGKSNRRGSILSSL